MQFQKRAHAVVIGGSMAGLCAARALSQHFERVTLVERDELPDGPAHRRGVPQSHHVHVLLLRGLVELERLFPGIEQEIMAAGAVRLDLGNDVAHCTEWGWAPRARVSVGPIMMSRLLIESVVRTRIRRDIANLTLLEGTRVLGLTTERTGACVLVTGAVTSQGELQADLVVDASGRNSKCLEWLTAAGVEPPEEELIDAFAGYASRFYELAPDPRRWWQGMVIDPKAPSLRRWGLLMPIEHGRSVLTLAGVNRDYPPGDEAGFHAYLESLLSPALAREISRAKPLSEIRTHHALSNRARHFHRWKRDVGGFIALGDGAIAFNASHGQGMSMAAVSANALSDLLASGSESDPYRFARRFQTAQWELLQTAWLFATGADLTWPETTGKRPWNHALQIAMSVSIVRAAHEDPQLKQMIGPIFQLLAEPKSLLRRPSFLARVAVAELRRRLGRSLTLLDARDFDNVSTETQRR